MKTILVSLLLLTTVCVLLAQAPLQDAFRRVDSDGDGKLTADEIGRFPQLKARLAGADGNADGVVSPDEFRSQILKASTPVNPTSSAETSIGKVTPGDHTREVKVANEQRRYLLHVPASYDSKKPTPVVIVYHGGGGNPESMIRLTGMNGKSDTAGFLVVYPYGTGPFENRMLSFNGGECCASAMENDIDDVGFTRALLDDLATVANVDADRVFATGLSNGGIMSHQVAAELADRIAAIAPVGGPLMRESIHPSRAVPVMHFHGTGDEFAPFKGGYGKGAMGRKGVTNFRSVEHTLNAWIKANGCNTTPEIVPLPDKADDGMKVTRKTWSGGKEGSDVVLIEIEGGGHTWPGMKPIVEMLGPSTLDISANDLMWEFFQKHPMKPTAELGR